MFRYDLLINLIGVDLTITWSWSSPTWPSREIRQKPRFEAQGVFFNHPEKNRSKRRSALALRHPSFRKKRERMGTVVFVKISQTSAATGIQNALVPLGVPLPVGPS